MKPYTNKSDRIDARKCLLSEINKSDKARKTAARQEAKKEINEKIFGIKTSDVPKCDPLRFIYPNKFR